MNRRCSLHRRAGGQPAVLWVGHPRCREGNERRADGSATLK